MSGQRVIAVAFDEDGRPFSIVTHEVCIAYWDKEKTYNSFETYDVNYCRDRDEFWHHNSGSHGGESKELFVEGGGDFWMDAEFTPDAFSMRTPRKRLTEIDAKWLSFPFDWGREGDTVYCKVCDDHVPTMRDGWDEENICPHLHWDDDAAWWIGEGSAE